MTNRPLFLIISGFIVCLMLAACDDAPQQVAPMQKSKKPAVKSAAASTVANEEPAVAEYVYDPTGTRDPFLNPLGLLIELPIDNAVPMTPLQKFSLDQLRVIGVIIGKGEPRAMVIAPDNKSFILKKGTKVGRNNGTVVAITTDTIMVEEQFIDYSGGIKSTVQEIKLPKQGGVK